MSSSSQNEPANLIAALEWLLRDQACGVQGNPSLLDESNLSEQIDAAPDSVSRLLFILLAIE